MYIMCLERPDGTPIVHRVDESIPSDVIQDLYELRTRNNMTLEDAVTHLRGNLVPQGYTPYTFRRGTQTEILLDKLRTLVATYRYRHRVNELKRELTSAAIYMFQNWTLSLVMFSMNEKITVIS